MFVAHEKKDRNQIYIKKFLHKYFLQSFEEYGFDNASLDCFTYILFNLNLFFLEQKFDNEYDRECVRILWTYFVPNEFYIFIWKHDNFNVLKKLSLK